MPSCAQPEDEINTKDGKSDRKSKDPSWQYWILSPQSLPCLSVSNWLFKMIGIEGSVVRNWNYSSNWGWDKCMDGISGGGFQYLPHSSYICGRSRRVFSNNSELKLHGNTMWWSERWYLVKAMFINHLDLAKIGIVEWLCFASQFCPLLAVWPWTKHLASQSFSYNI